MQRHRHDFGGEAESVLDTCADSKGGGAPLDPEPTSPCSCRNSALYRGSSVNNGNGDRDMRSKSVTSRDPTSQREQSQTLWPLLSNRHSL